MSAPVNVVTSLDLNSQHQQSFGSFGANNTMKMRDEVREAEDVMKAGQDVDIGILLVSDRVMDPDVQGGIRRIS